MPANEQLVIEVENSRQLFILLSGFHGAAAVALVLLALPVTAAITALMLIMYSFIYYVRKTCEVPGLIVQADNEWLLRNSEGDYYSVVLSGNTYISNWLTLLVFSSENTSLTYVYLLSDSVPLPVMRQLKSRLKVTGC